MRLSRFGAVGLAATAVYWLAAVGLAEFGPFGLRPAVAAFAASVLSVLFSYVCHHRLTFEKRGRHAVYLPRFLAVSTTLTILAAIGTGALTDRLGASPRVAATIVAVLYPLASLALNFAWVFRDRRPSAPGSVAGPRSPPTGPGTTGSSPTERS